MDREEAELQTAFDALDPAKVHFAILGDERADVCLLTRGAEHRRFLLELFGAQEKNKRFLFRRAKYAHKCVGYELANSAFGVRLAPSATEV
ncbi:hypothetical protein [Bradyrhizobium arachidis]|uniref:hypothetical protein n=1 Tax=Bradyrhizobium arachidis TaxID=858423 RepID=UPI0011609F88|nr:hypothetical protein [Bradyrhizobium arachidis]